MAARGLSNVAACGQCERKRIGFGLDSTNPPNRGGLRKDSDWIRSNVNAIRLNLDWGWTGCYGEIAVRCLFYNVLSQMTNAHIVFYSKSRARPV